MARGKKTGGRIAGEPNKRTLLKQEEMAKLAAGLACNDPLEIMLRVMLMPETSIELKLDAATRLAPYRHPRLAAVMVANVDKTDSPIERLLDAISNKTRGTLPNGQTVRKLTSH